MRVAHRRRREHQGQPVLLETPTGRSTPDDAQARRFQLRVVVLPLGKISGRNRHTRATAPTHPDEPTAHRSTQARPQKPRTQQLPTSPTQPLGSSLDPLSTLSACSSVSECHHLSPRAHAADKARLMPSACRICKSCCLLADWHYVNLVQTRNTLTQNMAGILYAL